MIVRNKATGIEKWIFSFPFSMAWFRFSFSVFFTHVSWEGLLIKEIELVVQIAIVIHQAEMNSRA